MAFDEDNRGELFYNLNHDPERLQRNDRGKALGPLELEQNVAGYGQNVNPTVRAFNDGPRGRFIPGGRPIIELFASRNLSTFLHETGHQWLEELSADAGLDEAPDPLKSMTPVSSQALTGEGLTTHSRVHRGQECR